MGNSLKRFFLLKQNCGNFFNFFRTIRMGDKKPDVSGVKSFDKGQLKKTETRVKNPLPTKESEYASAWYILRLVSLWKYAIEEAQVFGKSFQFYNSNNQKVMLLREQWAY